ncbi:MAG: GTP cyclohydrolase [Legionellales bacterium]|nr:GTP cyclohydrolase [Legionellales bacterium]
MLVIDVTYKKPLDEVNGLLDAHRAFLDQYYEQGIFIASGAKQPRTGGIILARTTRKNMEAIIQQDPFYIGEVADYHITEFVPTKYSKAFEHVVKN